MKSKYQIGKSIVSKTWFVFIDSDSIQNSVSSRNLDNNTSSLGRQVSRLTLEIEKFVTLDYFIPTIFHHPVGSAKGEFYLSHGEVNFPHSFLTVYKL